jgi:hypothetical protein
MKRNRRSPTSIGLSESGNIARLDEDEQGYFHHYPREDAIIRNIASFMTISDATSLTSAWPDHADAGITPSDSWAVGIELHPEDSWDIATPLTPALVALSPCENGLDDHLESMDELLRERRRQWAQEKLTTAIFAHPRSLRSYCFEAYSAAKDIRAQNQQQHDLRKGDPETLIEPSKLDHPSTRKRKQNLKVIHDLIDMVFHNVPLSVLIDIVEATTGLCLDTTVASFRVTGRSIRAFFSGIVALIGAAWDAVTNFNPFQLLEAIITMQFNAMGKTSEALASGLQSVATGVGSASSMALNRFSGANLSGVMSASSLAAGGHAKRGTIAVNQKLLKKLSTINDAAFVVSYKEYEDDTGGLTRKAISRTRRMMHYAVSLRPFVATVAVNQEGGGSPMLTTNESDSDESDSVGDGDSPFMCTPQSFPPTPHSRQFVMMQKSRFSEDDIFAARDRLRLHDALASEDEKTREMAAALKENRILAVFDDRDGRESDIELRCGGHVATKVGSMYYSTARGRVPLLRNCYVYFEMSVLPNIRSIPPITLPTLSIGLSTEEMPPNTLVGAWQGSVGLCTNGQILTGGQWCSSPDPALNCYTAGSTVGCLVRLDDDSAFETWDGVMITATVTFSVDGCRVSPVIFPPSDLQPKAPPTLSAAVTSTSLDIKPSSLDTKLRTMGASQISVTPDLLARPPMSFGPPETLGSNPPFPTASVKLLVPAAEDVFPTVTMQSVATSVMCRFSSQDILATSRYMIGAPDDGSLVYAIDGSVLNF